MGNNIAGENDMRLHSMRILGVAFSEHCRLKCAWPIFRRHDVFRIRLSFMFDAWHGMFGLLRGRLLIGSLFFLFFFL